MPFQRGTSLAPIILQTAQVMLQANAKQQQAEYRDQQMQAARAKWEEKMKLDGQVLELKQQMLDLKQQTEDRLRTTGEKKLDLQERGLNLRESLGLASLDLGERKLSLAEALGTKRIAIAEAKLAKESAGTKLAKFKERKASMQVYEEEAALRADAPPQFQSYSDTGRLLSYKAQRQHALDQYTTQFVDPSDPQVAATKAELANIDKELLERAKHKRRAMLESGITASITEVRGNLPDMVGEPPGEEEEAIGPTQPSQPTSIIDFDNEEVKQKAVMSAVGQDTMFAPNTAQGYIQTEHQRKKAISPQEARKFRADVYRRISGIPGLTEPQRNDLYLKLKLQ
jgi:hypothetical protein